MHRLSDDDTRRFQLDPSLRHVRDGPFTVDGVTETINDSAQHTFPDWNVHNRTSPLHDVAFVDRRIRTEAHHADVVVFQVQRHASHPRGELNHLPGLDLVQPIHARDTVTDG